MSQPRTVLGVHAPAPRLTLWVPTIVFLALTALALAAGALLAGVAALR
jgi:hypothetical protein